MTVALPVGSTSLRHAKAAAAAWFNAADAAAPSNGGFSTFGGNEGKIPLGATGGTADGSATAVSAAELTGTPMSSSSAGKGTRSAGFASLAAFSPGATISPGFSAPGNA